MRVIGFTARAKGGVIEIPQEYLKDLKNELRVIIVVEEDAIPKTSKHLSALSIETKGLVFDRDEVNAR